MTPRPPLLPFLLLAALAAGGCGPRDDDSPWSDARADRLSLRRKAAQLVVASVPAQAASAPAGDSASVRLRRWVRADGVGGLLLQGGDARALRNLLDTLQAGAAVPLLVAAPMDRGLGERLAATTELPLASALGAAGDADAAEEAGQAAAAEARALGVSLAILSSPPIAPDASLGPVDPRSAQAEEGTLRYAAGLREGGVAVAFRAFGGSGGRPLRWDRAALEAVQLGFLRRASADAAALVPAHAVLPSLTGDSTPLARSAVFLRGTVKRDLAFEGAVAVEVGDADAVRAIASGADLLLGIEDPARVIADVVRAVETGRLPRARLDEAVRRVFAAKRIANLRPPSPADAGNQGGKDGAARPALLLPGPGAAEAARVGMVTATASLGRPPAELLRPCRSRALVTSPGAPAGVLTAELASAWAGLPRLAADSVALRGPLSATADSATNAIDCLVVAAWPGFRPRLVAGRVPPVDTASADSAAPRPDTLPRRVVWIDFLPPTGVEVPAAPSVLVLPAAGAEAQRHAARLVRGASPPGRGPASAAAWPAEPRLRRADPADAAMSADSLARIDRVIRAAVDDGVFTGAAVVVGRGNAIVWSKGYGRTGNRPGDAAVDVDRTLWDLASLTKVVGTTAAVMALVEAGEVKLDAPVRRYVPGFRGSGKGGVTVRHLLTHTSGLPAGEWLYGTASSPEQALRQALRKSLVTPPGQRMVYSDLGMILLAEMVRRRAEEEPDLYLARRVFVPLGMTSTMYLPPLVLRDETAVGTVRSERPYPLRATVHDGNAFRLGGVAGHAGLFSTAPDVAVLARTLLDGGRYGSRRVFSSATVREFTRGGAQPGRRALGWDVPAARSSAGSWFSARSYGHTGFTGTSLWIDPDRDLFVVLLTNRTYANASQGRMLQVRMAVHDAAARSITDRPITPRAGTAVAAEIEAKRRAEIRRKAEAERRRRNPPRRPRRPGRRS